MGAARPQECPRPGELVRYGTAEWHALHPYDPRRLAGLVWAAEAWREYCDPVNIAIELLDELREHRVQLRQASLDVSAAADWAAVANRPTIAELRRRREAS